MYKIFLLLFFLFAEIDAFSQATNGDSKTGIVNINLPKTPESQGFEKYGNIQVSELTGSPNISIPLYDLKSRFLEAPITLSYNSSGIKVNQEASWVGLGFDLNVGGRITVETKGCIDNDGISRSFFSNSVLKYGMQKLFARLGTSGSLAILTYASTCHGCDTSITHNVPDDAASVEAMAQFGLGQPDIFHANFMGHSLTFYFDVITDSLKFLGEKSLFNINLNKDGLGRILNWNILDNGGNNYYFTQTEATTLSLPPYNIYSYASSTTAWLLTKIVHPAGDSISFSYTNYGNSYPSYSWSASGSSMTGLSNDYYQNNVTQQPAYLTKIETNDVAIDFILGNRDDIKGSGSKLLSQIRIRDKQTNIVKKKITFSYAYFNSGLGICYTSLPDSVSKYYRLRLKLNNVTVNDSSALQPPYQFFYYGVSLPDKYSFAQDHWGFYNGIGAGYSDLCSPRNLIPNTGSYPNSPILNGFNAMRDCSPGNMPALTMDSIIYPTGGSTKFIYEPHQGTGGPLGGGLRIKTIRNYGSSKLATSIEYTYTDGIYMGNVTYHTISYAMAACVGPLTPSTIAEDHISANGTANDNDLLVAYSRVIETQKDENGLTNGSVIKLFNLPNPRYTTGGYGFDVRPAHWPDGLVYDATGHQYILWENNTTFLYPQSSGFAPTPTMQLDGKLMQEQYLDGSGNLLKSINYYYTQAGYSQNFYSVRVMDNRIGGFDASHTGCSGIGTEVEINGARRFTIFVSPAKSFYTLTDSVVERTYQGANYIIQKKATKYNKYFQPQYEINYNSDGTQAITYTKTSLDYEAPHFSIGSTGDALLLNGNNKELPIEQIAMRRNVAGDTLVVQSRYNVYKNTLPVRSYVLETDQPLTYKTQFIPSYFNYAGYPNYPTNAPAGYDFAIDSKYKLQQTAVYNSSLLIKELSNPQGISAFIWDEYHNNILAGCTNASSADIAFTSFETSSFGNWNVFPSGIVTDITTPMGSKAFSLAGRNISNSLLSAAKIYIVSYWSKSGAQNVNSASANSGVTRNGWTYYEHKVVNPASGTITVSGSGIVDELRLYPQGAFMTTYAYDPLIGLISQSDANSKISYYEYDAIGRVARIRDDNKNIVKQFAYKYKEVVSYPFINTDQFQTYTNDGCGTGYRSNTVIYDVAAGKYGSFISLSDANQKALAEITNNGQVYANAHFICYPWYTFTACCQWGSAYNSFALTGTGSVNFSLVLYLNGTTAYGKIGTLSGPLYIPSGSRYVTVSSGGKTYTLNFLPTGEIDIIGPNVTTTLQLSGTYIL